MRVTYVEYQQWMSAFKILSHWYSIMGLQEFYSYQRTGFPVIWPIAIQDSSKALISNLLVAINSGRELVEEIEKFPASLNLYNKEVAKSYIEAYPLRSVGYDDIPAYPYYQGISGSWILWSDPRWDVSPFYLWDKMGNKIIFNMHNKYMHFIDLMPLIVENQYLVNLPLTEEINNKLVYTVNPNWSYKLHLGRTFFEKGNDTYESLRVPASAFLHEDYRKDTVLMFNSYWSGLKTNVMQQRPVGFFLLYYEPQYFVETSVFSVWANIYDSLGQKYYWMLSAQSHLRLYTFHTIDYTSCIKWVVYAVNGLSPQYV